jgi:hypothetical protein
LVLIAGSTGLGDTSEAIETPQIVGVFQFGQNRIDQDGLLSAGLTGTGAAASPFNGHQADEHPRAAREVADAVNIGLRSSEIPNEA